MKMRLLGAIVTTIIWEAALAAALLLGLPYLGIEVPLPVVPVLMVVLGFWAVWGYHKGTRALDQKPVGGLSSMVGSRGQAVSRIERQGTVKIGSELWGARSADGAILPGESILVIGQKGLRLTVKKDNRTA